MFYLRPLIYIVTVLVLAGICSCGKHIETSDVITDLTISKYLINADGSSTDSVSVTLNGNASADKRNIIFTTTSGNFAGGQNGQITVAAILKDTKLVATAVLTAPMSPGKIIIAATPQITSPNGDYILKDSITALNVLPAFIKAETSSFGIGSNFTTTDTITGTLKSINNKKVSTGAKVIFEDYFTNSSPAAGRFRSEVLSSNTNSNVMALYAAPLLPIGTNIYIKITVLNDDNTRSNIKDSVLLTINQ